ncbi:MAG: phage protein Gp27 family protein [Lysobacteraceae bacterium]
MGRKGAFDGMDSSLLTEVDRLIRGGRTIAEIRDHLSQLGVEVSNGAAGRYIKNARANMARYREAQEIAGQWVAELGENPRGDVGVLLAEMLKSVAFNTLDTMAGGVDGLPAKPAKPMDIMMLAKAIQSLEASAKQSIERRERIERAVLERQVNATEQTARDMGMGDAAWEAIRAKFLGVDQAPKA